MAQLIFDEATMIDGNIFKFEERLKTAVNKYTENGAMLVTYFSQDENSSTVDRGLQDIEELFGTKAPLRYNEIHNFPLHGFNQAKPEGTDEQQIEDINVEGECIIIPSLIVPKPYDLFIIQHLKMENLFMVTRVDYDTMKPDGYYKITYRLQSTSHETIQNLRQRVVNQYHMDLNQVGTNLNPIIKEDDFVLRGKITEMMNKMIQSYRAMFYNSRHNCFLFRDPQTGMDVFDMCGNEFIAKYSLMNYQNSPQVIILHEKLNEPQLPRYYNNSVYNWLEMGAPLRLLSKFPYFTLDVSPYAYSSFVQWGDLGVHIIYPLSNSERGPMTTLTLFDDDQFLMFLDPAEPETTNDYERLIWKFINKPNISIHDVSLFTGDALLSSIDHRDVFLYTPIIIYIIRYILQMQ